MMCCLNFSLLLIDRKERKNKEDKRTNQLPEGPKTTQQSNDLRDAVV